MTVSNYEFLAQLHQQLKPRGYLEVGVRYGDSLKLAECPVIGVDPQPQVFNHPSRVHIHPVTSDEFFDIRAHVVLPEFPVDLVYIDGMHLYEFALRDFINVALWANERTVVVFDDTHPYSRSIATREPLPGDWTGDVWKTMDVIEQASDLDLKRVQVDVTPTGAFVVWGFNDLDSTLIEDILGPLIDAPEMREELPVPDDILDRRNTLHPEQVIARILDYYETLEQQ